MRKWCLMIVSATAFAVNPSARSAIGQQIRAPVRPEPMDMAVPTRRPNSGRTSQGVLIDTNSNLGTGIGAELLGDYKEAVRLLTQAIADERADGFKLALAHRFRGLAY